MQEPSQLKSNFDLSENAQFHSPTGGRAPFPDICFSCVSETEKQTTPHVLHGPRESCTKQDCWDLQNPQPSSIQHK